MNLSSSNISWYQPNLKNISFDQIDLDKIGPLETTNPQIQNLAIQNNISPFEVIYQIRVLQEPEKKETLEHLFYEKIAYITDIHGAIDDQNFYNKLDLLLEKKPDYLIILGDVVGDFHLNALQKIFYNFIVDPANNALRNNPNISDQEFLSQSKTVAVNESLTIRESFKKIRSYELELQGKTDIEINRILGELTDSEIVYEVKEYCKFSHFGHYISNLPEPLKQVFALNMQKNAEKFIDHIEKFREKGTQVIFEEGNWDVRTPIDFVSGTNETIPLPPEQKKFDIEKFIIERRFPFYRDLATIETDTTFHILAPFDTIRNANKIDKTLLDNLVIQIENIRNKKAVILVPHGQLNWEIHHLSNQKPPTKENAEISEGNEFLVSLFKPDEVIYGHIHLPILNENREKVADNAKYLFQISEDNKIKLENLDQNNSETYLASFMEQRTVGFSKILRLEPNKKLQGLGGFRESIQVE